MMERIIRHLKSSQRILITTHIDPDGDGIGSMIAIGLSLEKWKKTTTLVSSSRIPAVYRFLPSVHRIKEPGGEYLSYDTAIVLDCGNLHRTGRIMETIQKIPVVVNIDHHKTNTGFGEYQLIDTKACATAEIVYRLLKKMNVAFDLAIASSIYTGILTDTGSFRFANTNRAAFRICDEMVSLGVNPYFIAQHVFGTYSLGRLKLLNRALNSIEISNNGKLSVMTLTREMFEETGTQAEDVDGMINYAKRIEDVKVAVLIQELLNKDKENVLKDRFHVSLRSDGSVDVGEIAKSYGGGGHFSAAGFNIEANNISELKNGFFDLSERM